GGDEQALLRFEAHDLGALTLEDEMLHVDDALATAQSRRRQHSEEFAMLHEEIRMLPKVGHALRIGEATRRKRGARRCGEGGRFILGTIQHTCSKTIRLLPAPRRESIGRSWPSPREKRRAPS